ncbi:hypothetical protein EG329_005774 [Mollisiaceae sp. DMI_Dod_QoI]|nr:hypothetical protein EG329_005774 [Helotiales sp. DMI_Dod_QoI]
MGHRQLQRILCERNHTTSRPRFRLSRIRRSAYYEYLEELKRHISRSPSLSTIKRRLVLDTGTPTFDVITWEPLQTLHAELGNPVSMLKELADAWGGRLEVNGLLAYEDGKRVQDIFVKQDGIATYYHEDDVNLWMMIKAVGEPLDGKHIGDALLQMDRQSRAAYYRQFEPQLKALKEKFGIHRIDELDTKGTPSQTDEEEDYAPSMLFDFVDMMPDYAGC